ncbi:NEL-type E3 ubiquitin ligase domain-containing protein [Pseudomonas yamanorum]|uniref:NEL-type E3 ubiquitin ligase domain-containing protein n=1 Tax=Pseudomonas yamanorum TaxID=515393 RepID=UPI003B9FC4F8
MSAPQASVPPLPGSEGRHFAQIKGAIPQSLISASPALRAAIRQAKPEIPAWYAAATPAQRAQLKSLLEASFKSRTAWEHVMGNVQEVNAFAQPLLEAALKAAGFALDVNQVHLRLYVPVEAALGLVTTGYRTKTLSLLQAALNNFEEPETRAGFFNSASGFITAPDADGRFERYATALTIDAFARLCRALDLGQQYQQHLTTYLLPVQTVSRNLLRERFITRQKDAFRAAAYLALLKGDIGSDDYSLLLRIADGERRIKLGDKQVWHRWPSIMDLQMHGCIMIDPCVEHRYGSWFIVYIPDHPEHPIKRYETFADYEEETTRALTAYKPQDHWDSRGVQVTEHQQFCSRFIGRKSLAYYYGRFTEKRADEPLKRVALGPDPEWRKYYSRKSLAELQAINAVIKSPRHISRTPQEQPNLNLNAFPIKGLWIDVDVWEELYADMRKRALDDALSMAVPTAQTDAASHDRRVAQLMNIGLFALNLVSMIIPPLGAVMAVVTAGQLMFEVLEGVIDLSQGDREAGWAHIGDVLDNLAQLAVGGAVLHFGVSPFIEGLKAVKLPSGEARLWKPDLAPYAQEIRLPPGAVPDQTGLHTLNGRQVLSLDGNRYAVTAQAEPGTFRVQHPSRPGAYEPQIVNNGSGAWTHEADEPLTWQGAPLMRRLGHVMDGLSDTQLEQVRKISDTDESVLRRLYVESEPTPAITLDTAVRLRAYERAESLSRQILAGSMSIDLGSYAASLMVEMPGWPSGRTIEVFEGQGASRTAALYGQPQAPGTELISISRIDLFGGKLPALVVERLSEAQLEELLGRNMPDGAGLRSQALQARLGGYAKQSLRRVFDSLYLGRSSPGSAELHLFARDFKSLPTVMVQELLDGATVKQRAALVTRGKIPLELAQQARRKLGELRLARAYEGLYLDALANADTEALVLNTLERLPGWRDNLRIEVHEGSVSGRLRASYGSPEATHLRLLVRVGDGQYQAFDTQGNELHGVDSLYDSLQHALPDAYRQSIGLPHVGQGAQLKVKLQDHALSSSALRKVLNMQSAQPFFKPLSRLSGGRRGYPLSGRGGGALERELQARIRYLYPDITDDEIGELRPFGNPLNDSWLRALESEFSNLTRTLRTWQLSAREGELTTGPAADRIYRARGRIVKAIDNAWRRIGPRDIDRNGQYRGQALKWEEVELRQQLRTLPRLPADFDHVSKLSLRSMALTSEDVDGFVSNFRGLRSLSVQACRLTRLPPALASMPHLTELYLGGNEIVMNSQSVMVLSNLKQLKELSLESNPLSLAPDVSRMPDLRQLWLAETGLEEWPASVFRLPRPRRFILDLRENALIRVPVFAPGSDNARIIARTTLSRELLSREDVNQFRLYIEAAGNDPDRQLPPKGRTDSKLWKTGLTEEEWESKQQLWQRLEDAFGSEAFFNEIRYLSKSADAVVEGKRYLPELTARVWRMLEAMGEDAELRDELFLMAVAPTACVDAGAQLFNAMGVKVMLRSAYASDSVDVVRARVFQLARGKWRLDELGRIAHERVAELVRQGVKYPEYDAQGMQVIHYDNLGNEVPDIDEVEIYLAYTARLSTRLDLPWQASTMLYHEEYVTPAMVEAAYVRVKALDQGEPLRTNLIEQPMWSTFLQRAHPAEYSKIASKFEALVDYETAQKQWAQDGGLSAATKQALNDTIARTADILGRPRSHSLPGTTMSQAEYDASLASIDSELKALNMALTDQAISAILGA